MKEKYRITIGFKILIVQCILSFIGLFIGAIWALNIESEKWSQLIYSDITIADIDLGGKTKEEAKNIIKLQYVDVILSKKTYVNIDDKNFSVDNSNLIKSYDIDSVIEEAFDFGKDLNIIEKYKLIKSGSRKKFNLDFTYNDDYVKAFTMNIEKEVNKIPVNASIEIKDENLIKINGDTKGYKLEKEKLEKDIEEKLKNGANEDIYIKASTQEIEAGITQNTLSVIDKCIATFSTSFQASSLSRANNIDISIKTINGKILMPGEIFSFNDVVGERTKDKGYMEAPVIIGNKFQLATGGGICQVSSTLYNAILIAGVQSIERTSHSLPISYVDYGFDATVDWGNIDFKFKNNFQYPIYIEGYTKNKILYINLFSNSSVDKKDDRSISIKS